jgi:hypothetical protein
MSNDLSFTISAKDQASKAVETVQKKIQNLGTDLAKGFLSFAAPLTLVQTGISMIGDAIAAQKQKVADSIEAYSGITDKAADIGVATDEFLKLNQAAQVSGIGVNKVAKLFQEVTTIIEEATTSGSSQEKMLKALGFSAEQIAAGMLKPIQVIEQMGIAMGGASTNTDRMAVATAMLGKNAADLIPVLLKAQQVAQGYGEDPGINQDQIALIEEKKRRDQQAKNKEQAAIAAREATQLFLAEDPEGRELANRIRLEQSRLRGAGGGGAGAGGAVTVTDAEIATRAEAEVLAILKKRREEAARLRQEAGAGSVENLNELEMQRLNTEAVTLALEDLAKLQADEDKGKEEAAKNDAKRTAQELDEAQKLRDEKVKDAAKNAKLTVSSLREIGGALAGEFIPSDPAPEYLKTIAETEKEMLKAIIELKEVMATKPQLNGVDFTKDPNQTMFTA